MAILIVSKVSNYFGNYEVHLLRQLCVIGQCIDWIKASAETKLLQLSLRGGENPAIHLNPIDPPGSSFQSPLSEDSSPSTQIQNHISLTDSSPNRCFISS